MTRKTPAIIVTNDDGVQSPGLHALAQAMQGLGRVLVVSPEEPRSGTSMSLTFHKPVRVSRVLVSERTYYAVSGSPADAVMIATHLLLRSPPGLVVSGINFGDNTTLQDLFASGTVAAATEAAIMGIPSIAFSMAVPESQVLSPTGLDLDFEGAASVARAISQWVLEHPYPPGVHLLNVNFPTVLRPNSKAAITRLARRKFRNYIVRRRDPRRRAYYWIWGKRIERFEPGTDAHMVHQQKGISVTPLNLNLAHVSAPLLEPLQDLVEHRLRTGVGKA